MQQSTNDTPRLIEHAFPLKQASLDSVHEKNVRHGHISTLHIWPARRPLAACRAALIATLLPDPGTPEKRKELCEKIGGRVVKKIERKKMPNGEIIEREKEVTEGGILHWGRETENKEDLEWFRQEIRKAYGGRAPKVLDPFAGGGAIPLEAMRLGCEATAIDINPVAWFILKCTLEYPQKLAGQTHPLPDFILENEEFMNAFYKAHPHLVGRTKHTKKQKEEFSQHLFLRDREDSGRAPKADLAWHVRAWGQWVLDHARRELAAFYPTYADFEPLDLKNPKPYERQPMRLVPLKEDGLPAVPGAAQAGTPDIDTLNKEFSKEYLADKRNPRWVAKPTVAYLWARTVKCKNCRATIPLLKTRWLCKKDRKRVLLKMEPNSEKTGVVFGIEVNVPIKGGNTAQRREHDKRIGQGTMSQSGAKCPCCPAIMTMEDISLEGQNDRLGSILVTAVVEGQTSKEYRLAAYEDAHSAQISENFLRELFSALPYGVPEDRIAPASTRSISCHEYGLDSYKKLLTSRQNAFVGTTIQAVRKLVAGEELGTREWRVAVASFLGCVLDKALDYGNTLASWYTQNEQITHLFNRYALPMKWDYAEAAPFGGASGSWRSMLDSVAKSVQTTLERLDSDVPRPLISCKSALDIVEEGVYDLVITDPPYYQAVSYADLSDFFYVWLRRLLGDQTDIFSLPVTVKDREIVQHIRADKNREEERVKYETWMANSFTIINRCLTENGRFTIVFAHKDPVAWETLVAAIIRAGFTVDGSWPIQTEMPNRSRGFGYSALSSSIWLIAKKRRATRVGWDNQVLDEMRQNIGQKLRTFWDAGIRGPDFVWAATGPALEAYSKHPVVKKANEPGPMSVGEFLAHVRRMVVDFVVGRVLAGDKGDGVDLAAADRLDEPTAYYLLHRHDFGLEEAPAGACILYAISCGISDRELAGTWDLIAFTKGKSADDEDCVESDADAEVDPETEEDSGNRVKLKTWVQRKSSSLGFEAPGGKPIPLIDRIHCLMHLWRAGDVSKVDDYLDGSALRRQELFKRVLQSLIELSPHGSEERSLLESISNHVQAKGVVREGSQEKLAL